MEVRDLDLQVDQIIIIVLTVLPELMKAVQKGRQTYLETSFAYQLLSEETEDFSSEVTEEKEGEEDLKKVIAELQALYDQLNEATVIANKLALQKKKIKKTVTQLEDKRTKDEEEGSQEILAKYQQAKAKYSELKKQFNSKLEEIDDVKANIAAARDKLKESVGSHEEKITKIQIDLKEAKTLLDKKLGDKFKAEEKSVEAGPEALLDESSEESSLSSESYSA